MSNIEGKAFVQRNAQGFGPMGSILKRLTIHEPFLYFVHRLNVKTSPAGTHWINVRKIRPMILGYGYQKVGKTMAESLAHMYAFSRWPGLVKSICGDSIKVQVELTFNRYSDSGICAKCLRLEKKNAKKYH